MFKEVLCEVVKGGALRKRLCLAQFFGRLLPLAQNAMTPDMLELLLLYQLWTWKAGVLHRMMISAETHLQSRPINQWVESGIFDLAIVLALL